MFVLFCFFETGFLYISLAVLELTLYTRLVTLFLRFGLWLLFWTVFKIVCIWILNNWFFLNQKSFEYSSHILSFEFNSLKAMIFGKLLPRIFILFTFLCCDLHIYIWMSLCWLVLYQFDTSYSHWRRGSLNWENASIRSGCRQACRAFPQSMIDGGRFAHCGWTGGPGFYKKVDWASH